MYPVGGAIGQLCFNASASEASTKAQMDNFYDGEILFLSCSEQMSDGTGMQFPAFDWWRWL